MTDAMRSREEMKPVGWTTSATIRWFEKRPEHPNLFGEIRNKPQPPFMFSLYTTDHLSDAERRGFRDGSIAANETNAKDLLNVLDTVEKLKAEIAWIKGHLQFVRDRIFMMTCEDNPGWDGKITPPSILWRLDQALATPRAQGGE